MSTTERADRQKIASDACERCASLAEALRFARGQITATYDALASGAQEGVTFWDMVGFELAMQKADAALGDEGGPRPAGTAAGGED